MGNWATDIVQQLTVENKVQKNGEGALFLAKVTSVSPIEIEINGQVISMQIYRNEVSFSSGDTLIVMKMGTSFYVIKKVV